MSSWFLGPRAGARGPFVSWGGASSNVAQAGIRGLGAARGEVGLRQPLAELPQHEAAGPLGQLRSASLDSLAGEVAGHTEATVHARGSCRQSGVRMTSTRGRHIEEARPCGRASLRNGVDPEDETRLLPEHGLDRSPGRLLDL